MKIGNKLRYYRKLNSMTMKQLGEIVGVSEQAIGQYERNERTPNLDMISRLAYALKVNINKLINSSEVVSIKLILALQGSNFIIEQGSDSFLRPLRIISMYSNVKESDLDHCLDKNIDLLPDDQIKLLETFATHSYDEFKKFIDKNIYEFCDEPKIMNKIKLLIGDNYFDNMTINPYELNPYLKVYESFKILIEACGRFSYAEIQEDGKKSIIISRNDLDGTKSIKLDEDELEYLLNETFESLENLIIKFNGIPSNPFIENKIKQILGR